MFIEKIQVFMWETSAEFPCILVHASKPREEAGDAEKRDESQHMLWEHMLRAKL
jgi:hypothetical protein